MRAGGDAGPAAGRGRSPSREALYRLIAVALPLALLAAVDIALRALPLTPPPDPELRLVRSNEPGFSPLAEDGRGGLAVRPEWVAREGYRKRTERGPRHGQYFIFPGFREVRFAHAKPPGALRVFALGDSTTFGLHVGPGAAYPALLGNALRARYPTRPTEVLNLGCPGWASDRQLALLTSLLPEAPDLFVVYAGQNELLDPGSALAAGTGPASRLRARMISSSALYGWLDHAARRLLRSGGVEAWREDAVRSETERSRVADPLLVLLTQREEVGADYRAAAARALEGNLRAMIERAHAAGVAILLVMPVENLATPPATPRGIAGGACNAPLAAAREAEDTGRLGEAEAIYQRCAEAFPADAALHYLHGMELERLGRHEEALGELVRAVDLDVETTRITSPLEETVLRVAADTGVPLVDPRPAFRRDVSRAAADALFVDHCHPTEAGHRVIARAALPAVARLLRERAGPLEPAGRPVVRIRRRGPARGIWGARLRHG